MIRIDTREPPKFHEFLIKTFPHISFCAAALKEGDYESELCLVERKTVNDLYGSMMGTKDKPGRLHDQLERLSVHQNEKVVILLITGSMGDFITKMHEVRKMNIDQDALYGQIASITCRYNIMPLWIHHPQEALITMIKLMMKIDEGKWQIPDRRDPHILSMKLLGISRQQYEDLLLKHRSLSNISRQPITELTKVHGIGTVKAQRILNVLNNTGRV